MKAQDIIIQLSKYLPQYTDYFSTTLEVDSMTFSGGVVTVTTTNPHMLMSGDLVNISGALSPNSITSLSQVDGVATAETADNHDLTELYPDGADSRINITGAADDKYNGDKILLDVINRRTFTYQLDETASASTTGAVLNENKNFSYNGAYNVTVTSPKSFTYTISGNVGTPATGDIKVKVRMRISGSVGISKTELAYSKQVDQNSYWAFVILEDSPSSKSRNTLSDADMVRTRGTDPRQKIIQNFSVYVFAPCKNQIAARETRDNMEDILPAILRSLLGYKPPTNLTEGAIYGITFIGHEFFSYTESTYIHKFSFQNLVDITFFDTIRNDRDAAFRDITINYLDPITTDGDDIIMTDDIDLDREPLP